MITYEISFENAKKKALAVTLPLIGQARPKALEIDAAQLNTENGMDIQLTALDSLSLQDDVDLAFTTYSDFERLEKGQDISMGDFIIEYERRCVQSGIFGFSTGIKTARQCRLVRQTKTASSHSST
ncbi:hypothetical protein RRG08_005152 [Elysia crispata]|uniref:Uncharacterized protein n=1 Tax=Elysia crispata TaxID=231223 RepID=A0AAE0ZH26_9GAST|nr:hypothetical protein RRG08_005152 [Elysia crispata]